MILSVVVAVALVVALVWYFASKGDGFWELPLILGGLAAGFMTMATVSVDADKALEFSQDFSITQLSEVTYELAPGSEVSAGEKLTFVYLEDGVSKTMSVDADIVRTSGDAQSVTIIERDYSGGRSVVPWGYGVVVTEAVVR